MSMTLTVQLPEDLCGRIQQAATQQHVTIDQYVASALTATMTYQDAQDILSRRLHEASDKPIDDILRKIPARKPLAGDEF
ncbi:MAG: hypothetical protein GY801_48895 [bacterium]|nr:hypothetical protein [bacterium]